jgi:RNA polymerase sigma factor (sigma-70 family)
MNPTRIRTVTRRFTDSQSGPNTATDADLLGRFLDARDQSAFADLVARHGPAVRAVCRSVLRDPNDADDAAQATFLVLVRRAGAVRDRDALGGWLCRVAWRTANRLLDENRRRGNRTAAGADPDATPATEPPGDSRDIAAVLEEIGRLPERYRVAVLTCYATGTSTAEAARQLGWPKGTLLTRLAWARKRLRDRLARRGVTLAGGLVAALAARLGAAGAAEFANRMARVVAALAADAPVEKGLVSERVFPLTNGVVRAMIGTKLKVAFGVGLLVAAMLGLALGRSAVGTAEANPGEAKKVLPADKGGPGKTAANDKGKAEAEEKVDAAPAGPGNELVVRRPLGSFTREVAPFGRGTLTFTETRLHIRAAVSLDGFTFTLTADADYSVNRESMVYGIITEVDVNNIGGGDEAAELALLAGMATDIPFAFRIRVEDESIVIKDIKFGPLGSPLFAELVGKDNEAKQILSLIGGKYKIDPNPDRNPAPPAARPKKKQVVSQ